MVVFVISGVLTSEQLVGDYRGVHQPVWPALGGFLVPCCQHWIPKERELSSHRGFLFQQHQWQLPSAWKLVATVA